MGEIVFDFEKLIVYKAALDLNSNIFKIYNSLSTDMKYTLGSQIIRASISISNNIAEGNGIEHSKEKIRFYNYSLFSTRECVSMINILKKEKLVKESDFSNLRSKCFQITSMLRALIKSVK
ncbi:MAG: hypothetical protein A2044_07655 [Candidatus Firestonebacteria bacterium GWA2_43_8]|nr:MAG: hypothetical protein A2044_07655 [Candidatus Firestonebacteria bacterium GWA2_43_8]